MYRLILSITTLVSPGRFFRNLASSSGSLSVWETLKGSATTTPRGCDNEYALSFGFVAYYCVHKHTPVFEFAIRRPLFSPFRFNLFGDACVVVALPAETERCNGRTADCLPEGRISPIK